MVSRSSFVILLVLLVCISSCSPNGHKYQIPGSHSGQRASANEFTPIEAENSIDTSSLVAEDVDTTHLLIYVFFVAIAGAFIGAAILLLLAWLCQQCIHITLCCCCLPITCCCCGLSCCLSILRIALFGLDD
ncbi:hypothetical protein J8273_8002 [Carpediemonas membranifera]|uniref:Uncharacterized protein n=1 Tax=Carpediemonas membranifera TaxID=201153 RepID=A0A8J6E1H4_9EUKA|nr:hypothetical protein J8273_8002 [Carpediemonas membranifera]|eukprot:KAG9390637.1 hypothetical protein J8273_8002 [Carpediemonas membranifera]